MSVVINSALNNYIRCVQKMLIIILCRWKSYRHTQANYKTVKTLPFFTQMIPRTQRVQSEQLRVLPPAEFAPLLIEKLERVRRDQEAKERLERRLAEVNVVNMVEINKSWVCLEDYISILCSKSHLYKNLYKLSHNRLILTVATRNTQFKVLCNPFF